MFVCLFVSNCPTPVDCRIKVEEVSKPMERKRLTITTAVMGRLV